MPVKDAPNSPADSTTDLPCAAVKPAWLGVGGYIAILTVLPVELLGIASLESFPGMLLYVPGGLFELLLPILLIARGFRRTDPATPVHVDEPQRARPPPTPNGTTMKAIVRNDYGSSDVPTPRDIDQPDIGDDEVLVGVHGAHAKNKGDEISFDDRTRELPHTDVPICAVSQLTAYALIPDRNVWELVANVETRFASWSGWPSQGACPESSVSS